MSLWQRIKPQSFGTFKQVPLTEGPAAVSGCNPYSEQFDTRGVSKPKDLVNYMVAQQTAKFGYSILKQFKYATMLAQTKRVMEKYSIDQLMRAIKIAVDVSNHPFSFKLVETICENKTKKG